MIEPKKPRILAIVGPTAVGKSALAISLAKTLGGEVLSCDSMQIYRGMDVGTAKPTRDEQSEVKHHLIDFVAPETPYSCFSYLQEAKKVCDDLLSRSILPIFCGGTGLYLDRFLHGGLDEETVDPALRERLKKEAEELCEAESKDDVIWEAADLIYFVNVLMYKEGVSWKDVYDELDRRHKEK